MLVSQLARGQGPAVPKAEASSMEVKGAAVAEDSAMQEPGAKVAAAPGVQARQTHELR